MKLWGGRFKKPTAPELEVLGSSIDFDRRLAFEDVRINRAYARELKGVGVLSGAELEKVVQDGVTDTEALMDALDSGHVSAAGLDVTDPEPLPADHPLWKRNVIITPHSAGRSPQGRQRAFDLFRENLRRFANELMLLNVVDKKAGY